MIRGKIIAIAFLAGMLSCSNNDSPRVPLTNQNLESTNRPVNPSKRLVAECALPRFSPTKLSQTCFFKLVLPLEKETSIYSNFFKYEPQYQAYSDGADKKRWIYFPPGQQMITKDLDNWIFSKGTVIFKEFLVGGKKI